MRPPTNALVVTPTLGKSPWLGHTIASVQQWVPRARHVLVAPRSEVGSLKRRFPFLDVLPEPEGSGLYGAINAVAGCSDDWEFITYINDDDLLLKGIQRALQLAQKGYKVVYGRVRLIDGAGRRLGGVAASPFPRLNLQLYHERLEPMAQQGTLLQRGVWKRLGGFDPTFQLCGDSDLLARATLMGARAAFVAQEVAAFRLRPRQLSQSRALMDEERRRVDQKLGLGQNRGAGTFCAWACYRMFNAHLYLERWLRHRTWRYDTMLARGG